jgi:hypothetical protein
MSEPLRHDLSAEYVDAREPRKAAGYSPDDAMRLTAPARIFNILQ